MCARACLRVCVRACVSKWAWGGEGEEGKERERGGSSSVKNLKVTISINGVPLGQQTEHKIRKENLLAVFGVAFMKVKCEGNNKGRVKEERKEH